MTSDTSFPSALMPTEHGAHPPTHAGMLRRVRTSLSLSRSHPPATQPSAEPRRHFQQKTRKKPSLRVGFGVVKCRATRGQWSKITPPLPYSRIGRRAPRQQRTRRRPPCFSWPRPSGRHCRYLDTKRHEKKRKDTKRREKSGANKNQHPIRMGTKWST